MGQWVQSGYLKKRPTDITKNQSLILSGSVGTPKRERGYEKISIKESRLSATRASV